LNPSYQVPDGSFATEAIVVRPAECSTQVALGDAVPAARPEGADRTSPTENPGRESADSPIEAVPAISCVPILGLPIAALGFKETIAVVERLIRVGKLSYFITANLHYARLCRQRPELSEVNRRAAFLVADGMPLVWWSRWVGTPLPERVTGADLVWALAEMASRRGFGIFLLGGRPGVAERAASILRDRFPGLVISGTAAPHLDRLSQEEEQRLLESVARSGAKLVFAAFGQPKGELWLARNLGRWGDGVAVQIGASLDFIAGELRRAPLAWQRLGLEWAFRLVTEPKRLLPRYAADAWFLLSAAVRAMFSKSR